MTGKTQVRKEETKKRQAEALEFARRISSGTGICHRIAQIVVNRAFEKELEDEISKLRKVIVE